MVNDKQIQTSEYHVFNQNTCLSSLFFLPSIKSAKLIKNEYKKLESSKAR